MSQMSFGGDWTLDKLEILRGYLDAYTTALKDNPSPASPFTLIYVDAFAGEGSLRLRHPYTAEDYEEYKSLVDGSVQIALSIDEKPFDRLYFIEKNRRRWQSLSKLSLNHRHRDIRPLNEDSNHALPWICGQLTVSDRAVVFLDPFATQVAWDTVATLAATQKIDSWILFPVGAVARLLPTSGLPLPKWRSRLDRIFGGREYWEDFYHASQQLSLFEDEPTQQRDQGSLQIATRYRERLESAFYAVAPTRRILRNSMNSPMFELFFAASNPVGAPIAIRIADYLLRNW